MKKIKMLEVLIIVCIGCNQTNTVDSNSNMQLKNDSLAAKVKPVVKGDLSIYEYDLSMYNKKYLMRITPTINLTTNKYETHILLIKQSDTIFNKRINMDSLAQTILKHRIFADSAEYSKIATDYELRKVVYNGVRTNDLYFVADIVSISGEKDLKVKFQLSYLNKNEIGKLFVNGFSKKGWGDNAGDAVNESHRKITTP